jgi:biotin carboxylase
MSASLSASILVTDGEQRSALAAVRSLGRAGHEVTVCAAKLPSLAGASRYAVSEFEVPDATTHPRANSEAVAGLLRQRGIRVALPMTEASLLSVLPLGRRFPDVIFPFPSLDSFQSVSDKTRVFEAARRLDILVPEELVVPTRADFDPDRTMPPAFPLVVKPARSVSGDASGRRKLSVGHAADRATLERLVRELPSSAFPIHLQRRVEGPGVGVFLLIWKGELVASFAHRRLREKPPSGGVSVFRESIAPAPDLVSQARRLLASFEWDGVAMVEFKLDRATGQAYLMEVNGRFWGSLQLAIDAGVDFPRLLVDASLGLDPEPVHHYRAGVRLRWFWGDVDHLAARLRRSRGELDLPVTGPGRLRAVADFLAAMFTGRGEVLRWYDPAPAWRETVQWLNLVLRRRAARPESAGSREESAL